MYGNCSLVVHLTTCHCTGHQINEVITFSEGPSCSWHSGSDKITNVWVEFTFKLVIHSDSGNSVPTSLYSLAPLTHNKDVPYSLNSQNEASAISESGTVTY